MDVEPQIINKPKILTWIGGTITGLGIILIPFGFIGAVLNYLKEGENFFLSLYSLYDFVGTAIGICAFGLAVSRGKRWHLFGLLIIVFFREFSSWIVFDGWKRNKYRLLHLGSWRNSFCITDSNTNYLLGQIP